jgi:hypothetical protein
MMSAFAVPKEQHRIAAATQDSEGFMGKTPEVGCGTAKRILTERWRAVKEKRRPANARAAKSIAKSSRSPLPDPWGVVEG